MKGSFGPVHGVTEYPDSPRTVPDLALEVPHAGKSSVPGNLGS